MDLKQVHEMLQNVNINVDSETAVIIASKVMKFLWFKELIWVVPTFIIIGVVLTFLIMGLSGKFDEDTKD